jgi:hypothetical protein
MNMTNTKRTLHHLLLAAATTLALGAISNLADAGVAIQFSVPGIVVNAGDPYSFSTAYCAGCWYGQWGGRTGYHRGGGRPWERQHTEADHRGHDHGADVQREGTGNTVPLVRLLSTVDYALPAGQGAETSPQGGRGANRLPFAGPASSGDVRGVVLRGQRLNRNRFNIQGA